MFAGLSIATLVMLPKVEVRQLCSPLASELCSLREHILMKNLKAYSLPTPQQNLKVSQNVHLAAASAPGRKSPAERADPAKPVKQPAERADPAKPVKQPAKRVRQANRQQEQPQGADALDTKHLERAEAATVPPPPVANHIASSSQHSIPQSTITATDGPASDDPNIRYVAMAEETVQNILALSTGTEQDGWIPMGTSKDVFMTKKPPQRGEQLNMVRGNGIIRAPPAFILRVLKNPKYTSQLDNMLKESHFLDQISDCVRIVHLLYKPVWPTAPRDFSLLSVSGQLNDNTWIQTGVSITAPQVPEEKGHVRAHLMVGGYVILECPDNPNVSDVTYSTKVDLKGSVPSFVVNKVTSNQPLCVHNLRTIVEPLYAELKQNPQRLREYEEEFPVHKIFPEKASQEPETTAPESETPVSRPKAASLTVTSLPAIPNVEVVKTSSSSPQLLAAEVTSQSRDAKPAPSRKKNRNQVPGSREQSLRAKPIENGPTVITPIAEVVDDGSEPRQDSVAQVVPRTGDPDWKPAPAFIVESGGESENESNGEEEEEKEEDGAAPNSAESSPGSSTPSLRNNMIVMESIEAYTPEEISSDEAGGTGEGEEGGEHAVVGEGEEEEQVFSLKRGPSFELKLPQYPSLEIDIEQSSNVSAHWVRVEPQ